MDSKQEEINEISSAVNELLAKVEKLKSKLDSLCKETGGCDQIKKINQQILRKKERNILNATHINALCEEE
jgi:outer membrane murein-binding lipoprotein Lpp